MPKEANQVADEIMQHVTKQRDLILNHFVDNMVKQAQRNFNQFEPEASTDDAHVTVIPSPMEGSGNRVSRTVRCVGGQVIFIEFGVGIDNAYRPVKNSSNDRPARGFDWTGKEVMPRPNGVVRLGHYHEVRGGRPSRGLDHAWIRPSTTGTPKTNEYPAYDRRGNPRNNAVWTKGHQPARALYRGFLNSIRKLDGGKL